MVKERRTSEVTRVTYYRRGYAGSRLEPADLDEELLAGARILHVTGILLALSPTTRASLWRAVELARRHGVLVSFDLNYRAALWGPEEAGVELAAMAERADFVFAGEEELALIAKGRSEAATAAALLNAGVGEVVVKRGSAGATVLDGLGAHDEAAVPVRCLDPVGAGDAFVAGYLAGVLEELPGARAPPAGLRHGGLRRLGARRLGGPPPARGPRAAGPRRGDHPAVTLGARSGQLEERLHALELRSGPSGGRGDSGWVGSPARPTVQVPVMATASNDRAGPGRRPESLLASPRAETAPLRARTQRPRPSRVGASAL